MFNTKVVSLENKKKSYEIILCAVKKYKQIK